jgi:Domain of unknown function (DUF6285)
MDERPEGHELLALAAEAFRRQIAPVLGDDTKYVSLMVLKAMTIAQRELREGGGARRVEPEGARAELARRVRSGGVDHDAAAQRALWELTRQRANESSPRAGSEPVSLGSSKA